MSIKMRTGIFIALSLALAPTMLSAQISFSDSDILALKGTSRSILVPDEDTPPQVVIGPAGTNQTWDYQNVNTSTFVTGTLEYQEPAGGLNASEFPAANFRQRLSATLEQGAFILDSYLNVTSNALMTLGSAGSFAGFETIEFDQHDVAPLPLTLGLGWVSASSDTLDVSGLVTVNLDTSWNTVDASGMLLLPAGSFESLRIREFNRTITMTTFQGTPVSTDTMEAVFFTWISKAHLQTFSVDSTGNGMGEVTQIVSGAVSSIAAASEDIPEGFALHQNYPNPFNPTTTIEYSLTSAGQIELAIYNTLGQKIRVLASGEVKAGQYRVAWNGLDNAGRDVASGLYFCRLEAGNLTETRRLILMR